MLDVRDQRTFERGASAAAPSEDLRMHFVASARPCAAAKRRRCLCCRVATVQKYFTSPIDGTPLGEDVRAMTSPATQRQGPAHVIIAGMVACLLVLQGLFLAASPALAMHPGDSTGRIISAAGVSEHCDGSNSDHIPTQGRHDHSQCCIFCSAKVRDAALVAVPASTAVASYSPLAAPTFIVRFNTDDSRKSPTGWKSSWSSRAPPSL
jgi:hypothetical protein